MERLTGRYYRPARADFAVLGALLWQNKPLSPAERASRTDQLLNHCLFWRGVDQARTGTKQPR